jgi:ureidoglycolate dehydrogenase (NAD+)
MPRVDAGLFTHLVEKAFDRAGLAMESRRHVVAAMVETSLRGVDSHGIQLFPHYMRALKAGRINARPAIQVERSRPSSVLIEADHAFGHHAGSFAIERCGELARDTGVGLAAVRNSTHFGAAAYFALQAARDGNLGFAFTNADALVRAANSSSPVFGTNPICMTAPMEGEEPFCLDMATSRVSWNKVLIHRRAKEPLPAGWAADAAGRPTSDSEAASMLEPIGDYKGFGLGMMVEILCGVLSGGPFARDILPMYRAPIEVRRSISHFFAVIRIDSFAEPATFRRRLSDLAQSIRSIEPAPGSPQVMVPGDPEKAQYAQRLRHGIPVDSAKWEELITVEPALEESVLK